MARMRGSLFLLFVLIPAVSEGAGGILVSLEFQEVKQGEPWFKAVMCAPDAKAAPTEATAMLIRSLLRAEDCATKPEAPTTFRITPATPQTVGPTCEIGIGGVEGLKDKPHIRSVKFHAYGWNAITYELVFDREPPRADFDKLSKTIADFAAMQGELNVAGDVQMITEHPPLPNTLWITIQFPSGAPNVPRMELLPAPKKEAEKGDRST